MLIFLDTNIAIYLIENHTGFGPRAQAAITDHRIAGNSFAVSDLVRLEARVHPVKRGDAVLLAEFDAFFAASEGDCVGADRRGVRSRHGSPGNPQLQDRGCTSVGCRDCSWM